MYYLNVQIYSLKECSNDAFNVSRKICKHDLEQDYTFLRKAPYIMVNIPSCMDRNAADVLQYSIIPTAWFNANVRKDIPMLFSEATYSLLSLNTKILQPVLHCPQKALGLHAPPSLTLKRPRLVSHVSFTNPSYQTTKLQFM